MKKLTAAMLIFSISILAGELKPPYSFEQIQSHIQDNNISSVPDFLASLPKSIRSQYVLMHNSGSQTASTPENPRAILYGKDAKLMIAFNADPKGVSYNKVELSIWDEPSKKFNFREVSFSSKGAHFSDNNPDTCKQCHGKDPHPLWDHYNKWEGAIGSNDGELDAKQVKYLKDLNLKSKNNPYYKNLVGLEKKASIKQQSSGASIGRVDGQPNRGLSVQLANLNAQRIITDLKADPDYDNTKYFYLYTAAQCYCQPHKTIKLNKVPSQLEINEVLFNLDKMDVNTTSCDESRAVMQIMPFLEKAMEEKGLDASSWNLNTARAKSDLSYESGGSLNANFLSHLLKEFPELKSQFDVKSSPGTFFVDVVEFKDRKSFCEQIAPMAFEQQKQFSTAKPKKRVKKKSGDSDCRPELNLMNLISKVGDQIRPIYDRLKPSSDISSFLNGKTTLEKVSTKTYLTIEKELSAKKIILKDSLFKEEKEGPSPNNELYIVKGEGDEVFYFRRPIETTVCLGGSCSLAKMDIILDQDGGFVTVATEDPMTKATWKKNHALYQSEDFNRLNQILKKESVKKNSILSRPLEIDAVSGATLKGKSNVVAESAYTTKEFFERVLETKKIVEYFK